MAEGFHRDVLSLLADLDPADHRPSGPAQSADLLLGRIRARGPVAEDAYPRAGSAAVVSLDTYRSRPRTGRIISGAAAALIMTLGIVAGLVVASSSPDSGVAGGPATWTRTVLPGDGNGVATAVTGSGSVDVSVGTLESGRAPVAWKRDGDSNAGWEVRSQPVPGLEGEFAVTNLAHADNTGFAAVGSVRGPLGRKTPLAWASADGNAWQMTALTSHGDWSEVPHGITVLADGDLVAVGAGSLQGQQGTRPVAWRSSGGIWQPIWAGTHTGQAWTKAGLEAVAQLDDGRLMAVGRGATATESAYISIDSGQTWKAMGPEWPVLSGITAVPGGRAVAITEEPPGAWVLADDTWSALPFPGPEGRTSYTAVSTGARGAVSIAFVSGPQIGWIVLDPGDLSPVEIVEIPCESSDRSIAGLRMNFDDDTVGVGVRDDEPTAWEAR